MFVDITDYWRSKEIPRVIINTDSISMISKLVVPTTTDPKTKAIIPGKTGVTMNIAPNVIFPNGVISIETKSQEEADYFIHMVVQNLLIANDPNKTKKEIKNAAN